MSQHNFVVDSLYEILNRSLILYFNDWFYL